MDRISTLAISRANNEGRLSIDTMIIPIIIDYMIEQKVKTETAQAFIQAVLSHPMECGTMIMECFSIALQYYEKKFGIFKLYKDRKLIAIY